MRSGGVAQRYCYCPRHYDNGIFVEIPTELYTENYTEALFFGCLNFVRSPIVRGKRMYFLDILYFTRNLPGFDNCGKVFTG